jgi:hypothetical protein
LHLRLAYIAVIVMHRIIESIEERQRTRFFYSTVDEKEASGLSVSCALDSCSRPVRCWREFSVRLERSTCAAVENSRASGHVRWEAHMSVAVLCCRIRWLVRHIAAQSKARKKGNFDVCFVKNYFQL